MNKIKVNFFDKQLLNSGKNICVVIFGILSFLFAFIGSELELWVRCLLLGFGVLALVTTYFIFFVRANKSSSKKLKINGTEIRIIYGDIFKQDGIKVISFNEYFDTVVDDKIISHSSLNGIFLDKNPTFKEKIDNTALNDLRVTDKIIDDNVYRKYGGKTIKYELGTICLIEDFALLAFTHFDENNRAYLSLNDYTRCLLNMWNEIDTIYAGKPITIPLLGDGITRFKDGTLESQELLKYILLTFKISRMKFTSPLTIILHESVKEKVNLYEITDN